MHNLLLNIKSYFNFAHFFDQETGVMMHFYVRWRGQGRATLSHQAQVRSKNISKITLLHLSVF